MNRRLGHSCQKLVLIYPTVQHTHHTVPSSALLLSILVAAKYSNYHIAFAIEFNTKCV